MKFSENNPFSGAVPETVPLPHTPLSGVLAQVRFPEVLSIGNGDFIAGFQERIRKLYPVSHNEQRILLKLSADGTEPKKSSHWRFFNTDQSWRISLATSFVAIETRAYRSRTEFCDRALEVLEALQEEISPGIMNRLGVRYVDQIAGLQFERITDFVRPQVLGVYDHTHSAQLIRTFSEVNAKADVGSLNIRSGYTPPNHTHEPDLMPPISEPCWFLDVDVFQEYKKPERFEAAEISDRLMKLATRAYGVFRWAVNDDLLRSYGGEV